MSDRTIILLSNIGSLILLNILAMDHFARLDLTKDQVFTLSSATQETLADLEDPVTITAYFSGQLPAHFESNRRFVQDLLEEYRVTSNGMLSYEFIDPMEQETDEDKAKKKEVKTDIFGRRVREKTTIETELERLGIQAVEIREIEDDQAKTKRAYMALAIRYQEETEVIPLVQSIANVEYDLTTLIRKLIRTRVPVLGVLQGKGEADLAEDMARVQQLLGQNYEVKPINLTEAGDEGPKVEDDIDGLLVVGTSEAYDEAQKKAIDSWLMKGKSVAFFLDQVDVDLKTFQPTPVDHGFDDMLAAYGIETGGELVADVECASLNIQERRGFMIVQMPVKYPFVPQLRTLEGESAITRGIADMTIPFATPLFKKDDLEGVELVTLAKSSPKSWLEPNQGPKLDPRYDWRKAEVDFTGPYDLIVSAAGNIPSAFPGEGADKSAEEARVVVVGAAGVAQDQFLSQASAAFMLNVVDWMLLDPALLEMRTRGLTEAPIDPELSDGARGTIKWGNVVGVPVILLLYGLVRWRGRRSRRNALMAA